jgi:hypothetical protein
MAQSINTIDKEFNIYQDISDPQEHHEKEMDRYRANWTTPFEPVEIYSVSGNTSSSRLEFGLEISPIAKGKKFTTWKQVAKYLRYHNEFFGCYGYEEEDLIMKIWKKDKLIDMFEKIINTGNMDPVMFVYANNPMIQWFKNVRNITA